MTGHSDRLSLGAGQLPVPVLAGVRVDGVAAILLDGIDRVILGLSGAAVPPSRAWAVVARARSKGAVLPVTEGHWGGVDLAHRGPGRRMLRSRRQSRPSHWGAPRHGGRWQRIPTAHPPYGDPQ
ncbi:hypothetical protein [Rhodococcus koreensis]|uniref:hypothetical protein n=1 Tax=Rhodococcus koreensis TaxID=99653 RepID=UPI003672E7F4